MFKKYFTYSILRMDTIYYKYKSPDRLPVSYDGRKKFKKVKITSVIFPRRNRRNSATINRAKFDYSTKIRKNEMIFIYFFFHVRNSHTIFSGEANFTHNDSYQSDSTFIPQLVSIFNVSFTYYMKLTKIHRSIADNPPHPQMQKNRKYSINRKLGTLTI